jgi:Fur family ferric uptake transcriptional regulator
MPAPTPIIAALEDAGYRLTGPRRALADLIADRGGSTFTAADLVADARARRLGIGRATVFRAIELLVSVGAVERVDLQSGEHAYVACVPTHHHHVICSRCARATEMATSGSAPSPARWRGGPATGWTSTASSCSGSAPRASTRSARPDAAAPGTQPGPPPRGCAS